MTKVTITGADDSIDPIELIKLSEKFPFVEWGILFSKNRQGSPRYPSVDWIDELSKLKTNGEVNFSAHICGDYTKDFFNGHFSFEKNHKLGLFKRVQLNFNSSKYEYNLAYTFDIITRFPNIEFIFQYNKANEKMIGKFIGNKVKNISFLYDSSGGRGIAATQYLYPLEGYYTGYSGGLSPLNIEDCIKEINRVSIAQKIWIDMESGVRSNNDELFDLDKVKRCLEISGKYVNKLF